MRLGIAQCLAELVAARDFNARRERPVAVVHGAVTTGNLRRFQRLRGCVAECRSVRGSGDDVCFPTWPTRWWGRSRGVSRVARCQGSSVRVAVRSMEPLASSS